MVNLDVSHVGVSYKSIPSKFCKLLGLNLSKSGRMQFIITPAVLQSFSIRGSNKWGRRVFLLFNPL